MKKYIYLFVCLFFSFNAAATLDASVNTNEASLQSPIVLTIKTDQNSSLSPDLSVLSGLFDVLSTSVSHQSYAINGSVYDQTEWTFSLLALKKGRLFIPSITLGNEKTSPIEINVSDQVQAQNPSLNESSQNQQSNPSSPYSISTEIYQLNEKTFVNEQIIYAVQIHDNNTIESGEPAFEPTTDFIIKGLGAPKIKQKPDGGRIITYLFALFAQKSGELHIPQVSFDGLVYQKPDIQNIFQGGLFQINLPSVFGIETPVHLQKEGPKINILPKPQTYSSLWWLPAKNVQIEAKFINPPQKIVQGSVISREIELSAEGLTDSQLPELSFDSSEDIKVYPEKPSGETLVSDGGVKGVQKTLVTYIPQKSGTIVLPEIKVLWYNTLTNQSQTAVLEAQTLFVHPDPNKPSASSAQAAPKNPQNETKEVHPFRAFFANHSALLSFLAGLLIAFAFFRRPQKTKNKKKTETDLSDLDLSAKKNDLKAVRNNIISLCQKSFPNAQISNLNDVSNILGDPKFDQMAQTLSGVLYNDKGGNFKAKDFVKTYKKALKNRKQSNEKEKEPIPPLYQ